MNIRIRTSNDRGAILVHLVFGLMALMILSTFVVDYGALWASRRMAQNSADAAALAGAVALAFDNSTDFTDTGAAKVSAYKASQTNLIWGQAPNVNISSDITFPACPDGNGTCIRVDVYRTKDRGNPIPTFFGLLFGQDGQDIKATATAQVAIGNATNCLKPWAVIDKWAEHWPTDPGTWTTTSTFDKYDKFGNLDPSITHPDVYIAPTVSDPPQASDVGTGFHPFDLSHNYTSDYGLELTLHKGDKSDFSFASGWFADLALGDSTGKKDYNYNIKHCVGTTFKIGDNLDFDETTEPGKAVGPTEQGVEKDIDSLLNQDPTAVWNPSLNNGYGGVDKSAFPISPRIVAIPLVNPDAMADAHKNGRGTVPIANIAGFFVESWDKSSKSVVGRLMTMPDLVVAGTPSVGSGSAFLTVIQLVR